MLSRTPSFYSLRSFSHISNILRVWRSSVSPLDPEQCDIRFLPAGRCHLNTSLHPHILTVRKHVWLYQLTFLPSGHSVQAEGRHALLMLKLTVWSQETLAMPTSIFTTSSPLAIPRYYCHILFSSHSGSRAFMGRDFPLFLSYQCHISLFDFLAFTPFEVQRYEH